MSVDALQPIAYENKLPSLRQLPEPPSACSFPLVFSLAPPKTPLRWVRFPKRTHRFPSRISCATNVFIATSIGKSVKKRWVRLVEWHVSFARGGWSGGLPTAHPPNCRARCLSYRYRAVVQQWSSALRIAHSSLLATDHTPHHTTIGIRCQPLGRGSLAGEYQKAMPAGAEARRCMPQFAAAVVRGCRLHSRK